MDFLGNLGCHLMMSAMAGEKRSTKLPNESFPKHHSPAIERQFETGRAVESAM